MGHIPLLPHRPLWADLSLQDDPEAMFRDALRGRVYFWTMRRRAVPPGWVEVWPDRLTDTVLIAREPIAPFLKAWCWFWEQGRWTGHRLLINLGFLQRDARLGLGVDASAYTKFRWQWRFWRGPYYEVCVARGWPVPRWRDTWRRWR